MDDDDRKRERRKQTRLGKLGTDNPVCTVCGERDWRVFDQHHTAGRNFDATEQIVCKNDHARLSDNQYDHPAQLSDPPNLLERVGHFLLGLADWLALLIEKFREFGHGLIEEARKHLAEAGKLS